MVGVKREEKARPTSPFSSFLANTRQHTLTPSPTKGFRHQARSDFTQVCSLQDIPGWQTLPETPMSPPFRGPCAGGTHPRQCELLGHPSNLSAVNRSHSCLPVSFGKVICPPYKYVIACEFLPPRKPSVLIVRRCNVGGLAGNKALQPKSPF